MDNNSVPKPFIVVPTVNPRCGLDESIAINLHHIGWVQRHVDDVTHVCVDGKVIVVWLPIHELMNMIREKGRE